MAFEGVAHLTHALRVALAESQTLNKLSSASIANVFTGYQTKHMPRVQTIVGVSANLTRVEAQETTMLRIASRYIVPMLPDALKVWVYGKFSRSAPIFTFLPTDMERGINSARAAEVKV